jgi:hypothetical protein
MKIKLFVIFLGLVLMCSSCSLLLMTYAGIKIPKSISIEKVYHLAQKNKINKSHISFIKPGYQNYIKAFRLGIPGGYLFNKEGQMLYFKNVDNNGCVAGLPIILSQLNSKNKTYPLSQAFQLQNICELMVDKNGINISASADLAQNDFIFIGTFSSFYQKGSEYNRSWEAAIHENKNAKIKYYHFNLDVLSHWNPLVIDTLEKEGYLNYKWYHISSKINQKN